MKIARCTLSPRHWLFCTRKPIICPHSKKKDVKPLFGMPTQEVFQSGKWHIAGCDPDFPRHRDWGCNNCDAAFFKEPESAVDSFLKNKNDTYSFNAGN